MSVILCSRDEESRALSHGIIMCTEEEADFLMHYRTPGSKNGVRRWQYEDGSLTPEGYIHYGIGKGNKHQAKADKLEKKVEKAQSKLDKHLARSNSLVGRVFGNKAKQNTRETLLKRRLEVTQAKQRIEARKAKEQDERGLAKFEKDKQTAETESKPKETFKDRLEAMVYPPELRGKSKEEKKAWETEENRKFDEAIEREKKAAELNKKISRYDKLNDSEKQSVREEAEKRLAELKSKDKLSFEERIEGDGLDYWLAQRQAGKRLNEKIDSFDDKMEKGQDKHALMDSIRSTIDDIKDGYADSDPDTLKRAEEWFDRKISEEKDGLRSLIDSLDNYDEMSASDKSKTGDWLLEELAAQSRIYRDTDDYNKLTSELQHWLVNAVSEKSGSMNAGEYKQGTEAYKANEKARETQKKVTDRENQIRSELGYDKFRPADKRLMRALQDDDVWMKLDIQWNKDLDDVNGAILKDLGFPDNSRNRSILWRFGWYD